MNIGVFCSANNQIDSAFFDAAEALGQWMAQHHHTLVYGGCHLGLMEIIGQAVHAGGGTTIGVVPRLVEQTGRVSDAVSVTISCEDLTDRKQIVCRLLLEKKKRQQIQKRLTTKTNTHTHTHN